jgi:hypothetical protein
MSGFDVSKFRAQAAAAKAERKPEGEPVEIWGIEFIGRRVSMMTYLINGRVPTYLTDMVLKTRPPRDDGEDSEPGEDVSSETEIESIAAMGAFSRQVIRDVVISPVIVFEESQPLNEGEVYAHELPEGWLEAVYNWGLHHSPGLSMAGVRGAGSSSLGMFPGDGEGAASSH